MKNDGQIFLCPTNTERRLKISAQGEEDLAGAVGFFFLHTLSGTARKISDRWWEISSMAESRARWRFTAGDFFSIGLSGNHWIRRTRERRQMKKNRRREKTAARIFLFFNFFSSLFLKEY